MHNLHTRLSPHTSCSKVHCLFARSLISVLLVARLHTVPKDIIIAIAHRTDMGNQAISLIIFCLLPKNFSKDLTINFDTLNTSI